MLRLLQALSVALRETEPCFIRHPDCPPALQGQLWAAYLAAREAGILRAMCARKGCQVFRLGSYVVKEYTGDRAKVEAELAVLSELYHHGLVSFVFVADQGSRVSMFMEWAGDTVRVLGCLARQHAAPQPWAQPQQQQQQQSQQQQQQQQLQQRQQQQPQPHEDVARHIMRQLTASLAYLHQRGIVHRDIKPDNIGVQPDLTAKIFDWGEAVQLHTLQRLSDREVAKTVAVAGTPLFMPPEVLRFITGAGGSGGEQDGSKRAGPGQALLEEQPEPQQVQQLQQQGAALPPQLPTPREAADSRGSDSVRSLISPKLDVWGLGTVCYFLLSGRDILPDSSWELHDIADVINTPGRTELPPGTAASPVARDFLRLCLERDPQRRASAAQLLAHPWLAPGPAGAAGGAAAPAAAGVVAPALPAVHGARRARKADVAAAASPPMSPSRADSYVIAAVRGPLLLRQRGSTSSCSSSAASDEPLA